jgi:hypothetical protein
MNDRGAHPSSADPYSPQRRTALVLTGTGTAGAYHAGVLRALHEAGVKIDLAAGSGIGAVGALFAAMDGGSRLWEERGFWRSPAVRSLYPWRRSLTVLIRAIALAAAIVAVPLAAMAIGLIVFPIDFLLKMIGIAGAGGLTGRYLQVVQAAFAPTALPTWLPRVVLLVIGGAALTALATSYGGWRERRSRGAAWWRLAPAPLSAEPAIAHAWTMLWDLLRGATPLKQPSERELGRRYVELVGDNLGQPGFRELLIVAHDVDANRDLIFALVHEQRRTDLIRRPRSDDAEARRAEVMDLGGTARDHLADAIAASLTVPLANDYHVLSFPADGYWRGERHRVCDRPAALTRLLDEVVALGALQIVLVSAAADTPGPHALASPRLDGRGRLGEYLRSSEAALLRDLDSRIPAHVRLFVIRPAHNPIGPFDFDGGFDDGSMRSRELPELIASGYEDAYHQFIEPVVGASGERVGR